MSIKYGAIAVLLVTIGGCRNDPPCIAETKAIALLEEGRQLESADKPQAARMKYKQVDNFSCENTEVRAQAFDNAVRLQRQIESAYADTMAALNRFREMTGRYPATLEEIKDDIPIPSRAAFAGFKYVRRGDADADIVTGLYGAAQFDLNGR
jgi:hypothetical protein